MGSKKKEVLLSIANSERVSAHSYYVLCRYVCACAQTPIKETPIIWFSCRHLNIGSRADILFLFCYFYFADADIWT